MRTTLSARDAAYDRVLDCDNQLRKAQRVSAKLAELPFGDMPAEMNARTLFTDYTITSAVDGLSVIVYNADGDIFFESKTDLGDEAYTAIIRFVHMAHKRGVKLGEWLKANEIRRALNVPEAKS